MKALMNFRKAVKRNKKRQPVLMHAESFNGAKSIYANERECACGYVRPVIFFVGNKCDVCRKGEK